MNRGTKKGTKLSENFMEKYHQIVKDIRVEENK